MDRYNSQDGGKEVPLLSLPVDLLTLSTGWACTGGVGNLSTGWVGDPAGEPLPRSVWRCGCREAGRVRPCTRCQQRACGKT